MKLRNSRNTHSGAVILRPVCYHTNANGTAKNSNLAHPVRDWAHCRIVALSTDRASSSQNVN